MYLCIIIKYQMAESTVLPTGPDVHFCLAGNDTLQTLKVYLIYISKNFSYVLLWYTNKTLLSGILELEPTRLFLLTHNYTFKYRYGPTCM